ncbi:MAG: hypothetical protein JNK52_03385 [Zoogloeaceae bacterium]|nr:hypothetical protein [Zoogloeaceae bacterium]
MPDGYTINDAASFWGAPEEKIFPLPVVAEALGISRNDIGKLPIRRLTIDKRGAYRKADVTGFMADSAKRHLLDELQAKRARRIAPLIEAEMRDYFARRHQAELKYEMGYYHRELDVAPWPLDDDGMELLRNLKAAASTLESYGRKPPEPTVGAWWTIADESLREKAHRERYLALLRDDLEHMNTASGANDASMRQEIEREIEKLQQYTI